MRRLRTFVVLLAVFAAACSSSGDDVTTASTTADADSSVVTEAPGDESTSGADVTTTGQTSIELTASYQGVTETEIRIGIAAIDTEALIPFGVDLGVVPVAEMYEAWAEALNGRGGILGRNVVPSTRLFLPVGDAESEAICVEFAQDIEVFAVTGQFIGDTALCVTQNEGLPYLGHFGLNSSRDERSNGLFFATEMSIEDQRKGGVTEMIAQGELEGKTVALHWDLPDDAVLADAVRPILEDAGIDVVVEAETGDFGEDQVASDASLDTIIQRFQADGVDFIISLSNISPITEAVARAGFEVTIGFTNGQAADGIIFKDAVASEDVKSRTFAITTFKPNMEEMLADPGVQQCLSEFEAAFPDLELDMTDVENVVSLNNHCRAFSMLVQIMTAAGADLTPQTFRDAGDNFGPISLPTMEGELRADHRAAGSGLARYEYDSAIGEHVRVGDQIPYGG